MSQLTKFLLSCCGLCGTSRQVLPSPSNSRSPFQRVPVLSLSTELISYSTATTTHPKKLARIESMYSSQDIKTSEFRTTSFKEFQYNCPICFCYFNKILEVSCCKNYVCHSCALALNHRVLRDAKTHSVTCPFCSGEDIVFQDVNPNAKIRKYTDTPCEGMTPRQSQLFVTTEFTPPKTSKSQFDPKKRRNSNEMKIQGSTGEDRTGLEINSVAFASDGFLTMRKPSNVTTTVCNSPEKKQNVFSRDSSRLRAVVNISIEKKSTAITRHNTPFEGVSQHIPREEDSAFSSYQNRVL